MKAFVGTGEEKRVTAILLPAGGEAAELRYGAEQLYPSGDSPYLTGEVSVRLAVPEQGTAEYMYWRSFLSIFTNGFRLNYTGAAATDSCWSHSLSFRMYLPVQNAAGVFSWRTVNLDDALSFDYGLSAGGLLTIANYVVERMAHEGYFMTRELFAARGVRFAVSGWQRAELDFDNPHYGATLRCSATNVLPLNMSDMTVYFLPNLYSDWRGMQAVLTFEVSDYESATWSTVLLKVTATASDNPAAVVMKTYPDFTAGQELGYTYKCNEKGALPANAAGVRMTLKAPAKGACSCFMQWSTAYEKTYSVTSVS